MISSQVLPPGGYWAGVIQKHQCIEITDLDGCQGVDFLCYNSEYPEERYHAPNTLKAALTLKLSQGHHLYSDEARPIFTIIKDTYGGHDTIGGCCSEMSNQMLYGVKNSLGCRENFIKGLHKFNLGRKDIVPNINFFCDVPVDKNQKLDQNVFVADKKQPGAFVLLRAEINALAVISNCPQIYNPCNQGNPSPVQIKIIG